MLKPFRKGGKLNGTGFIEPDHDCRGFNRQMHRVLLGFDILECSHEDVFVRRPLSDLDLMRPHTNSIPDGQAHDGEDNPDDAVRAELVVNHEASAHERA